MTNQEALDICNRLLNEKPYSTTQLNVIYDEIKLVCEKYLQAIDRLDYLEPETQRLDDELIVYKKALDFTCKYSICFKDECDTARDLISCDECRKKFALDKARKEFENGK